MTLGAASAEPESGATPEQAAREAAGAGVEGSTSSTPAPPTTTGEGLIQLSESMLGLSIQAACARRKIPWGPEPERLSKFTTGERASLRLFAPLAEQLTQDYLKNAPVVGMVAFSLSLVFTVAAHARELAQANPKPKSEASANGSAATESTGSTAQEEALKKKRHAELWGNAADALPVGSVPEDVGFRSKFEPGEPD